MLNITMTEALARVSAEGSDYLELIKDGRFDLGLYRPIDIDPQTPHARDELYIVVKGSGRFICAGRTHHFSTGDVFFVPAQTEHRFIEFSAEFATWVIFFASRRV